MMGFRGWVAAALCAATLMTGATTGVEAKGCIKGAILGGIAGHFAGRHGLLGAAAGCVVGRHLSNRPARTLPPPQPGRPMIRQPVAQ